MIVHRKYRLQSQQAGQRPFKTLESVLIEVGSFSKQMIHLQFEVVVFQLDTIQSSWALVSSSVLWDNIYIQN